MISCLVLSHPTITSLTKCRLLRSKFHQERYEIEVEKNHTVIIYLWYMDKMDIWQAAFNIEMMDIRVGYGFGENREAAKQSAYDRLALVNQE